MSTYTKLSYHVVFGTKHRRPLIRIEFRDRLYEYLGGIIRGLNGSLVEIGGVEDHIHLLANLPATIAVSDAIREIKSNSSKWFNELPDADLRFEWQKGYAAFTVSSSQIERVCRYLKGQVEHHRRKTFQEEYVEFLTRNGIEFEERYLFEGEHCG